MIELAINHISGTRGSVAGVYDRSELLEERREALVSWAGRIAGLVGGRGANVVALRAK